MSIEAQAIESLSDPKHLALVALFIVVGWWMFPVLFKLTLRNGGGKEMRRIIDEANVEQSKLNAIAIKAAIAEHEKTERAELRAALAEHRIQMEHWLREERFPINPSEE